MREREAETEKERETEREREREKKRKPLLFSFSGYHLQFKANLGSAEQWAARKNGPRLGAAGGGGGGPHAE